MAAGEIGSEIIPGKSDPAFRAAIVGISLLLAFSTVYTQWRAHGGEFLETAQAGGHRAILENKASSPFQYRVLTEWGLELILRWSRRCGISSPVPAFILARGLQNFVIFILAAVWYRRVAGKGRRIVLGLVLLAWGMSYAFRDSTLEFSTYSEVIFYLLAALAISARRDWWIPAITLAAALNRETAAFIPFAYLAGRIQLPFSKRTGNGRALLLFVLSLGLYLGVFLGLRLHFGWRPLARVWQHRAGIDLFVFNLTHTLTWAKLIWTLSILPLVCLFTWRVWPSKLKRWALVLLPACFLAIPCYQWLSETRAVLVPLALVFVPGTLLLEKALAAREPERRRFARTALIIALSLATVYAQAWVLWPRYLRESQLERHRDVMENRACNPWQYRVLSEGVSELLLRLGGALGIASPATAFLLFRLAQNAAIFLLAAAYYRRMNLAPGSILSGLILLGWGMSYAFYNSDLHFSTYSDIIFYLVVLLAIGENRDWWIPPLTLLAALNRETSVFIPLVFLFSRLRWEGKRPRLEKRSSAIFLLSVALYLAAYFGLRLALGWRSFTAAWGTPGPARLWFNLIKGIGWQYFFLTVNILPLLCLASFRKWPRALTCSFWGIAAPWLATHYFGKACLEETRFLLLPLAIVFIPGALLLGADRKRADIGGSSRTAAGARGRACARNTS